MLMLSIEEKDLEKSALVNDWFTQADAYASQYHSDAEEVYKLYKQEKDDDWPLPIQLKTADTFALVEDAVSLLVESFCSVDPVFRVKTRYSHNPKISEQLERVMSILLADSEFRPAFEKCVRSGVTLGNGYLKVTPRFEDDWMSIKFEPVDYFNVYPDPLATDITDARYVIIRRVVHRSELLRIAKTEHHIKNAQKLYQLKSGTAQLNEDARERLARFNIPLPEPGDLVELWYVYVRTESSPALFILADRTFEVYSTDDPHPYVYGIPIVMFKFIPFQHEFFSIGIPHVVKGYQKQMNLLRSARITNLLLALSPAIRVTPGLVNPEDISFIPGAFIPAPDGALEPFTVPDMTGNSHLETRQLYADMEVATGLIGPARGVPTTKRQTGVEVIRLQQASLRRYDTIIKRLEFEVMRPLATRIVCYIREFMTREQYETMLGEEDAGFYELPLPAVKRMLQFQAVGAQVSNIKELRARAAAQAWQILASIPPQLLQQEGLTIDYKTALMELLKALDIPDPEMFLKPVQQQPLVSGQTVNPQALEILQALAGNQ